MEGPLVDKFRDAITKGIVDNSSKDGQNKTKPSRSFKSGKTLRMPDYVAARYELLALIVEADAVPGLPTDKPEILGTKESARKMVQHNIVWQAVIF